MTYNLDFVNRWMKAFGAEIIAQKEYISDLDAAIGDSDHGFNMAKGMEAYEATIAKTPAKNPSDVFMKLAMVMLSKVGGSSGPLYGSAFMKISAALKGKDEFTLNDFATGVEQGLQVIEMRGRSHEGEKTMDDVWGPVSRALKEGSLTPEQVDKFVEATKPLKATKGRASYLGDRSIGHVDPGSYSSGLFFKTFLTTK